MQRRHYLAAVGTVSVAGCLSSDGTTGETATREQPSPVRSTTAGANSDKPDGIYVQTFQEQMSMQGRTTAGDYGFALMFTVPHTFWTVSGNSVSRTPQTADDTVHLMAAVWDDQTQMALPETGLSVEIRRDGSLVSEEVIYPMLSQPMGFHYGGNFGITDDGTYTAELSVGATNTRRAGEFIDRLDEPASADITLEYTDNSRAAVTSQQVPEGGQRGAIAPMEMMGLPNATAPSGASIPGSTRGTTRSDDATFLVSVLDSPPAGVDGDGQYVAVSARTRYNEYVLPAMQLAGKLTRDGTTVYDGPLTRTIHPELGYHYGTVVGSVQSSDELALTVETIPQVARHEGYETAFRAFETVDVSL